MTTLQIIGACMLAAIPLGILCYGIKLYGFKELFRGLWVVLLAAVFLFIALMLIAGDV